MKSKNLSKKLKLNKKTIARLSDTEMNAVQGGDQDYKPFTWTCPTTSWWICCI